jgi:hypothetical protein
MLFFLQHYKRVQHVELLEKEQALDYEAIRPIDDCENQCHYTQCMVVFVSPETFAAVEVPLEIKFLVERLVF